ncbi:MAG: rhodanese-like domain-containing protein, partial [Raineya sp.]
KLLHCFLMVVERSRNAKEAMKNQDKTNMNMKFISIAFFSVMMLTTSCSEAQKKSTNKQNKVMFQNLNVNEFEQGMTQSDAIIIDVRTPMEYNEGHIKNSKLIDISNRDFEEQIEKLDKSKAYYVYCRSGGRSSNASQIMVEKGFTKVYNLQGGIIAWAGAKKAMEK